MASGDIRELEHAVCEKLLIGPRWLVAYRSGPCYQKEPPGDGSGLRAVMIDTPAVATDPVAFDLVAEALVLVSFWPSILRRPETGEAWHAEVERLSVDGIRTKGASSGEDYRTAVCRACIKLDEGEGG